MKSALLVLVVAACGATSRERTVRLQFPADESAKRLVTASQSGAVTTIRELLGPKVVLGGLWFPDADCTREFAAPGEIGGGRLDELARCLTTVKLQMAGHHAVLDDVAVLSYAPGIEVEARIVDTEQGRWLSWIGYADVREASDRLPTLTQEAFDALRDGNPVTPAVPGHEFAWLRVCIDASGHVTNAHVRSASSMEAGRTFAAAAQSWHFHPFTPAGQALPACALVSVVSDGGKVPGRPPTLATPNGEPMLYAKLHRTRGGDTVILSRSLLRDLREHKIRDLITAIRFCVNDHGDVYGTRLLRSSGVAAVDRMRLQQAATSAYDPFRDGGKSIAACTVDVQWMSTD